MLVHLNLFHFHLVAIGVELYQPFHKAISSVDQLNLLSHGSVALFGEVVRLFFEVVTKLVHLDQALSGLVFILVYVDPIVIHLMAALA